MKIDGESQWVSTHGQTYTCAYIHVNTHVCAHTHQEEAQVLWSSILWVHTLSDNLGHEWFCFWLFGNLLTDFHSCHTSSRQGLIPPSPGFPVTCVCDESRSDWGEMQFQYSFHLHFSENSHLLVSTSSNSVIGQGPRVPHRPLWESQDPDKSSTWLKCRNPTRSAELLPYRKIYFMIEIKQSPHYVTKAEYIVT